MIAMNTRSNVRWMLSMLVCAAMLLGSAPSFAAAPGGGDGAFQAGGGSVILKNTLRAMAIVIRKMAPEVVKITSKLDRPARKAFDRFAPKIADELEYIAEIPGLFPKVVGDKMRSFLINELSVGGGSALVISQAIESAILLFL